MYSFILNVTLKPIVIYRFYKPSSRNIELRDRGASNVVSIRKRNEIPHFWVSNLNSWNRKLRTTNFVQRFIFYTMYNIVIM